MPDPISIARAGAVTSVGASAPQVATSVCAGLTRIWETGWSGQDGNPYRGGFLQEGEIAPLHRKVRDVTPHTPVARLLQLAGLALGELAPALAEPRQVPPVIVAVPDRAGFDGLDREAFLDNLMRQSQVRLNLAGSEVVAGGREAGLEAIRRACDRLAAGAAGPIIAGGVDSYYDLSTLWDLDMAGRILNDKNLDAFLPGEGAGFLLLSPSGTAASAEPPMAEVLAQATGFEPGHLGASEPMRGVGLSETLRTLIAQVPPDLLPCPSLLADLNGENLAAKEWGIAMMRNREGFVEDVPLLHPAENFGDAGAAMGPIMAALAACGIAAGRLAAPAVVACCGDAGPRAALCLAKAGSAGQPGSSKR